jgi:heme oxygenase
MTEFEQHQHGHLVDAGSSVPESIAVDFDAAGGHIRSTGLVSRVPAASRHRPLSELLRERTKSVHAEAERSGVIADILRRKADQEGYALLLRNLLPAYDRLEAGLSRQSAHPVLRVFARRSLHRSARLRDDLARIAGTGWERSLPLLASGSRYADCIARAAAGDGLRLASHAYVRYFGDLSGGQVLKKLLRVSLSLPAEALTIYDFPGLDAQVVKDEMRDALDHAGRIAGDPEILVAEAIDAFEHNVRVSRAVQDNAGAKVAAPV